jgi:hypothetical protein
MSTPKKTIGMLRHLISEVVKMRVIAQYVDVDANGKETDIPGIKSIDTLINDDDGDDVNFILKKYNRGTPIFGKDGKTKMMRPNTKTTIELPIDHTKTGSGSGTPKRKTVFLDTENAELMQVATDLVGPEDKIVANLIEVISPFGIEGYDAIYRLWSVQERYSNPFPFFTFVPELGKRDSFPTAPSNSIVQKIAETRPNVGGKATGRGELLFALLTGGIAGAQDCDIVVAGKRWEVKDITGESTARIGEATSAAFSKALADETILAAMRSVTTFSTLSPTQLKDIGTAWAQATAVLTGGFVLVDENEFLYVDRSKLMPIFISSNGRITVKIK